MADDGLITLREELERTSIGLEGTTSVGSHYAVVDMSPSVPGVNLVAMVAHSGKVRDLLIALMSRFYIVFYRSFVEKIYRQVYSSHFYVHYA